MLARISLNRRSASSTGLLRNVKRIAVFDEISGAPPEIVCGATFWRPAAPFRRMKNPITALIASRNKSGKTKTAETRMMLSPHVQPPAARIKPRQSSDVPVNMAVKPATILCRVPIVARAFEPPGKTGDGGTDVRDEEDANDMVDTKPNRCPINRTPFPIQGHTSDNSARNQDLM